MGAGWCQGAVGASRDSARSAGGVGMVRWHWAQFLLGSPRLVLARARDREGRCGAGYLLDMERNEEVVCCSGASLAGQGGARHGMALPLGCRGWAAIGMV